MTNQFLNHAENNQYFLRVICHSQYILLNFDTSYKLAVIETGIRQNATTISKDFASFS